MRKRHYFVILMIFSAIFALNAKSVGIAEHIGSFLPFLCSYAETSPVLSMILFTLCFSLAMILSLPFAIMFMFFGGGIFGLACGATCAFAATAIASLVSFYFSRHFLRSRISRRYESQLLAINRGLDELGGYYLFSLRLVPVLPFTVLNLAMGLTSMQPLRFLIISQLGMLPGLGLYVWAGTVFTDITSLEELVDGRVVIILIVLAAFPFLMRRISHAVYRRYQSNPASLPDTTNGAGWKKAA